MADERPPGRPRRALSLSKTAIGSRAAAAVVAHLRAAGIEIIAVNLRVGRLELDVVAREGAVIVIVEVRARGPGAWVRAMDSVDPKKRARLRTAGEQLWRDRYASDPTVERMRFDLAAVTLREDGSATIEIAKAVL